MTVISQLIKILREAFAEFDVVVYDKNSNGDDWYPLHVFTHELYNFYTTRNRWSSQGIIK